MCGRVNGWVGGWVRLSEYETKGAEENVDKKGERERGGRIN